jgi:hypothetical protein
LWSRKPCEELWECFSESLHHGSNLILGVSRGIDVDNLHISSIEPIKTDRPGGVVYHFLPPTIGIGSCVVSWSLDEEVRLAFLVNLFEELHDLIFHAVRDSSEVEPHSIADALALQDAEAYLLPRRRFDVEIDVVPIGSVLIEVLELSFRHEMWWERDER